MSESFYEKLGKKPILVGILLFDGITSVLTFLFSGVFFVGDVFIVLGMMIGSIYIFYQEKDKFKEIDRINIIKSIILLVVFGGIVTGFSITTILFFYAAAGLDVPYTMFDLFLIYVRITVTIALVIGIIMIITFFSLIEVNKLLRPQQTKMK